LIGHRAATNRETLRNPIPEPSSRRSIGLQIVSNLSIGSTEILRIAVPSHDAVAARVRTLTYRARVGRDAARERAKMLDRFAAAR
jgi:hypothetical protein